MRARLGILGEVGQVCGRAWASWAMLFKCLGVLGSLEVACSSVWASLGSWGSGRNSLGVLGQLAGTGVQYLGDLGYRGGMG